MDVCAFVLYLSMGPSMERSNEHCFSSAIVWWFSETKSDLTGLMYKQNSFRNNCICCSRFPDQRFRRKIITYLRVGSVSDRRPASHKGPASAAETG